MAGALLCRSLVFVPKSSRFLCGQTQSGLCSRPPVNDSDPDEVLEVFPFIDFKKSDTPPHKIMNLVVHGSRPPRLSSCYFFLSRLLPPSSRDTPRVAGPFFALMLAYGAIPDASMFSLLVKSHCIERTYQDVLDAVFIQMKAMQVKPNDSFYRVLMYSVCTRFGPYAGYQLLKRLRSAYPDRLPLSCYNRIVHRFCEGRMVKDEAASAALADVLMDLKQQGMFPDERIHKYMLQGRCNGGEALLKAFGIERQMFAQGIRLGEVAAANLIKKDIE